ncbi:hypothetical protein ACFV4N_24045 [Actinosynnema sp. NPDC059797]
MRIAGPLAEAAHAAGGAALGYPTALATYVPNSLRALPALLRNEISAQALLFRDSERGTADAAYRDNPVNRYLNAAAAAVVAELVRARGRLRVLELGAGTGATTADLLPALTGTGSDRADPGAPFPLLPLQQAYFTGQQDGWELSCWPAHFHGDEVEDALVDALRRPAEHQPVLRARVDAEGNQHVLPLDAPGAVLVIYDLRDADPADAGSAVERVRVEMSTTGPDPTRGPGLDIRLTLLPDGGARLHTSMSLLVVDGWSTTLLNRDPARAKAVPGASEAVAVDLGDADAPAAFTSGCAVVVDCAGPSYRVLDVVARAALRAGAGYVDAAGDAVALDALTTGAPPEPARLPAVFSAGLLPRLLAEDGPIDRLDVYVGGSVEISPLSAVDALLARGPRFGHALATWRDGGVVEHAPAPLRSVTLPGFEGRVHAWPFPSAEMGALAAALGVAELRNYTVYATGNLPTAPAAAWADDGPLDAHVDAVVEAARRDVAECGRHYALLAHARPPAGSGGGSRRVLPRTPDPYELSGVVAALAAVEILTGGVPSGAHHAADVLDPRRTAAALAADDLVTALELPRKAER